MEFDSLVLGGKFNFLVVIDMLEGMLVDSSCV